MRHKVWTRWIYRHFSLTCMALVALAAGMTVTISLATMNALSRQDAGRMIESYTAKTMGAILIQDYQMLHEASDTFAANPRIDSVQAYRRNEQGHLIPMYGKVNHAEHGDIPPYLSWAYALFRPLFMHELNQSITMDGREVGRAAIVVDDWQRTDVAVKITGILLAIFLSVGAGVYWLSRAGQHYLQNLLRDTYRESGSARLRSVHSLYDVQRYPILSRIHQNIRKMKLSLISLQEENALLHQKVARYQKMLHQEHMNHETAEVEPEAGNHTDVTATLNYSIMLAQQLRVSAESPANQESLTQLYHALVGMSQEKGLRQKGVSRQGQFSLIQLTSMLHIMACHHRTHEVAFYPSISLQQHYQGRVTDVMHIATRILHDALEVGEPKSHLTLTVDSKPITRHLQLTCLISSPRYRSADDDAPGHLSQRRLFSDLYDDMVKLGVSLHINFQHPDGIALAAALPLRPAVAPMEDNHLVPEGAQALYLVDDGSRTAFALIQLYRNMGAEVIIADMDRPDLIDNDQTPVILPMTPHVTFKEYCRLRDLNNPIIAIVHSRASISDDDKIPTWIKGLVDLDTSPLSHLKQIAAISHSRNVASITGSSLKSLKVSTALSELFSQHEAEPSHIVTVWIPADLPALGRASLEHALGETACMVQTYHEEAEVLTEGQQGDMVFVQCDQFAQGCPPASLQALDAMSLAGISVVALSQSGSDEPSTGMLNVVDKVVSLPADPGYLSSIIAARCGV